MQAQQTQCEREIQKLRDRLVHMSVKVRAMISGSLRALVERDDGLARTLIACDKDINRLEIASDQLCLRILAKRQPVATQLRTVALCVKMVTDLERIGDLAAHICDEVLALNAEPAQEIDPDLPMLGQWVETMVQASMSAFVQHDANAARQVLKDDERADLCFAQVFRRLLLAMVHDTQEVSRARRLQTIATHLERIGDHATNLARLVIFMVEGKDVRHTLGRSAS